MDSTKTLDTSLVQTLKRTNPQLQIGVHRVLYKHGDIHTLQRVGNGLHGKGVSRCTGTNPQDIYTVLQAQLYVLRSSHLGRNQHLGFLLHLLQPYQSGLAMTLKATGLGTRLPHTSAEVMAALHSQLLSGCHYLFLGFSTTRACNHKGTFVVTW